jgi:hypothetical protein
MSVRSEHQTRTPGHSHVRESGALKAQRWPALAVFLASLALYTSTAAPGTLFGDPSEYQFIPAILGIAHPPGYAFYTLVAKLWQVLVPVGGIAFRTNRLASAAAATVVTLVYLIVVTIGYSIQASRLRSSLAAGFAAFGLAVSADFWQHGIHSNAHIVSSVLVAVHLFLLIQWWRSGHRAWLNAFALVVGLSATQHPITLIGVPAYLVFAAIVEPDLVRRPRAWFVLIGFGLVGLLPLLYYPLRSASTPFGPTDMGTWPGFWRHVTAQGLRVNLFHFGLADQMDRAVVFWSLSRLQFTLPVILMIVLGGVWLAWRRLHPAILFLAFIGSHLLFTLNTVQDVMAYLLFPLVAMSVLAGLGALWLIEAIERRWPTGDAGPPVVLAVLVLFPWPLWQATVNLDRGIALTDFTAADTWVANVRDRFGGASEGAVLLSDWEHLTPLWVSAFAEGGRIEDGDLATVYVSTSNPWVESAWSHIDRGPLYVPDFRPSLRDAGFRLVPSGDLYEVVAAPSRNLKPENLLGIAAEGTLELMGYDLPTDTVRAGEHLALTLYQRVRAPLEAIWMPFGRLGPVEARWTTDSRILTTSWQPGEVIAEKYEIPVSFQLAAGTYPLRIGVADLSAGREQLALSNGDTSVEIARVRVLPALGPPPMPVLDSALANLDNRVALLKARVSNSTSTRYAPWKEPLLAQPGGAIHLLLSWQVLASPRESYTVFVHLLDSAGNYVTGYDYTPLGGACPSYLWFPKWLQGQSLLDPYRLEVPDGMNPGDYWLEVGMYGMTSIRRLPVVDFDGNLAGDRVIIGAIRVQ